MALQQNFEEAERMNQALTAQSDRTGRAAGAGGGPSTPSQNKFIAKAKAHQAANPGSGSKPASASVIPVTEGAITILKLVIAGFIVGVAFQGVPLFAMRSFFYNSNDDVDPCKDKFFVNGVEKKTDPVLLNDSGIATIKCNPHMLSASARDNIYEMTTEEQRSLLRSSQLFDQTGWSWMIFPSTNEGTRSERHVVMHNGINMLKEKIHNSLHPDAFPRPRRLLRIKVSEHAMEVTDTLEELIRDLPEMEEALRTLRMERISPTKHSL